MRWVEAFRLVPRLKGCHLQNLAHCPPHSFSVEQKVLVVMLTSCSVWDHFVISENTLPLVNPKCHLHGCSLFYVISTEESLQMKERMGEFHRVLSCLSLMSGRRLPTTKGPIRGNPRMRSRFTTITLLLSNEHAPPLTCGLSVSSVFRVAVISFVAEKSTTTLNILSRESLESS